VCPGFLVKRYMNGVIGKESLFSNLREIEKYLDTHKVIIVANESSDDKFDKLRVLKEYFDEKKITYTVYLFDEFVKIHPDKVFDKIKLATPSSPSDLCTPVQTTMNEMSEIIDDLFLSGLECANPSSLEEKDISNVISVLKNPEPLPKKYRHEKIEVDDTFGQGIETHFERAHQVIDEALQNNEKILVHCRAGISRSATIVISYIMKSQRMKFEDALKFVKSKRRIVSPNMEFFLALQKYEGELNL
jgi:protein-tyrosine phosphatase